MLVPRRDSVSLETDLVCTAAFVPERFATFAAHLDTAWINEALESTGTVTLRRRRLPMDQLVWLVIGMGLMRDKPIAELVDRLDLALPDKAGGRSVVPSAVAQGRARLGAAPLEWLFLRSALAWAEPGADRHRWRGLGLYAVDGTTLRIADSDENRRHFGGQSAGTRGRGESGYPMLRLAALMALRSHLLVAASFGPYAVDERRYAEDLWDWVPDDSLVLLDRNYLQANVMVRIAHEARNRHWLMRAKANSVWKVLARLGPGDALVEMKVSSVARQQDPSLPKTLQVRAIRYQRKGYRPQTLLTSLLDPHFPAAELRELCHERWEIGLGYDELKTEMLRREETIRSRTIEGVRQEVYGILIAYNLVRLEMVRVADLHHVPPVRVSFVATLRLVTDQWEWAAMTRTPGAIPRRLDAMERKLARFILPPRRSDRVNPRAVKVKMSNYALKRPRRAPRRSR